MNGEMNCMWCDAELKLFRLGRAHLVCIECGRDVTLHLVMMQDAGISLAHMAILTPEDYKS